MDILQHQVIRIANNMEVFADGEATINFGEFIAWEKACIQAGKVLPPKDFKSNKNP